jgi:hypothetical protein
MPVEKISDWVKTYEEFRTGDLEISGMYGEIDWNYF